MDDLENKNRLNKDEYSINRHRKKIAALILAVSIYLLFLGPLILDLVPESWRSSQFHESFFIPDSEKNIQRTEPAPVKYVSPTQKPPAKPQTEQSAPPPIPPVPIAEKTPEKPSEQPPVTPTMVPKKRLEEPVLEPRIEPKLQEIIPDAITIKPLARITEQEKTPETEPIDTPERKMPHTSKRRGRKKWLKDPETDNNYHDFAEKPKEKQSLGTELSRGLYEHIHKNKTHNNESSLEGSQLIGDAAGDFEINIFNEKFDRNFCDDSRMHALYLKDGYPVRPHTIAFELTCTRQRKIINVNFIQKSYDERINKYIEEICSRILVPQFPTLWPNDTIILQRSIDLTQGYQGNKVCFYAKQFWT